MFLYVKHQKGPNVSMFTSLQLPFTDIESIYPFITLQTIYVLECLMLGYSLTTHAMLIGENGLLM